MNQVLIVSNTQVPNFSSIIPIISPISTLAVTLIVITMVIFIVKK